MRFLLTLFLATACSAQMLIWDAPAGNIERYNLYFGPGSRNYTNAVNVKSATNADLRWMPFGSTLWFAVTDMDSNGCESDFSNEVQYQQTNQFRSGVVLSMELVTDANGVHPMLHVRGTRPGSNYLLIEATNLGQVYWACDYWAQVPFWGDVDVGIIGFTNQQMFFRVQQIP